MRDSDVVFLRETLALAELGRFTCAPNPTVGCLIVRHGRIIGRGHHHVAGQGHAEVQALADVGGSARGATAYVSLEPCAFEGRTPACAATLIEAGVARVVIAAVDPHPQVAGAGIAMLEKAGVTVDVCELDAARTTIQGYVKRVVDHRPWVRIKTASSLDGAVALADGSSKWITGSLARQDVQYWRARSDAIITGVGTVVADDPALTVRDMADVAAPLRVILDSHLRIPADARVVTDGHPTLCLHRPDAVVPDFLQQHASVSCAPVDPGDLNAVLAHLAGVGCNEVLVEAGPAVVASFFRAGLWDDWVAYVAPKLMGHQAHTLAAVEIAQMAQTINATIQQTRQMGADVRMLLVPNQGEAVELD